MLKQPQWESLYREHETTLFNIALRWTWNQAEAQELVQDGFLKLWDARRRVDADTARAYLYRIVLNLCQNHARKRQNWWDIRALIRPFANEAEKPDWHGESGAIRRALETLSTEQRQVVLLCELTDLKQREIAELLEIPPGTVASRRQLALKNLRKQLHD